MIIRHVDLASLKYCNRGSREFCARHGIDWSEFVTNGVDSSKVEHIDDAMLKQVIEQARRREQGDR